MDPLSAALDVTAAVGEQLPVDESQPAETRFIGLALAIASSFAIGTSFIITKKVRTRMRDFTIRSAQVTRLVSADLLGSADVCFCTAWSRLWTLTLAHNV